MQKGGLREAGNWDMFPPSGSPIYSIITVVYNGGEQLAATIENVLAQSYPYIEYILIDGNSTDGSIDTIRSYDDRITYWQSEPDGGLYDAMNKGLEKAMGDYVWFMNVGDYIEDDKVVERLAKQHSNADIIYGETHYIDEQNKVLGTRSELTTRKLPTKLDQNSFKKGMLVAHQSFIAKRNICSKFDLKYSCSADIDWCISAMKKADSIERYNGVLSKYLIAGFSIQNQKTCWKERFNISVKHYGFSQAVFYFLFIVLRGVIFKLTSSSATRVD